MRIFKLSKCPIHRNTYHSTSKECSMRPVALKIVRLDAEIYVFCVQPHLDVADVQTAAAATRWGPVKVFIWIKIVGLV